jgi:hypothetical protein
MIRPALLVLGVLLAPVIAYAQGSNTNLPPAGAATSNVPAHDRPVLRVTLDESETIPGQPLTLSMTVLAPTFMPKPPVWPGLEAPNLLVRVPPRGGGPTSERIGGQTWSGVSRLWRITPMVPGDFSIPPQTVLVTWADPETNKPRRDELRTDPLALRGKLPDGAEGLTPFIGARSLALTQKIEGDPAAMKPGDSVTRTVTARVSGTSPMFLPDLLPSVVVEGVAAYPDTPIVNEVEERGVVGGVRTEATTYVAEGGGRGQAPAITFKWFNLGTGKVETATAEGFDIVVTGPPARTLEQHDWRRIAVVGIAGLLALAIAAMLLRRAWPQATRWYQERHAAWLASEHYAFARLRRIVGRHDHAALRPALDEWAKRFDNEDPRLHPAIATALLALGKKRYGTTREQGESDAWEALATALPQVRRAMRATPRSSALPRLNATKSA